MSNPFSIGSGDRNTSSTIGQANGNTYNNNGDVFNITVAQAKNGGADGLSASREEQQQQQNPLAGLLQLLNPMAMLGMLGGCGSGGNMLKLG